MANFITNELNLIFGWIDQKLKAKIDRSSADAPVWKTCVTVCIALAEMALEAPQPLVAL